MAVKAVIFDFDGTLINACLRLKEAKELFVRRLQELGFRLERPNPKTPSEVIIQSLIEKYGIAREYLMDVLDECFRPYELELVEKAELRDGAREVVHRLREMGYRLGVVSNNDRLVVKLTLEKFGLINYFDAIVARGDVDKMKPDELPILECVKKLGVRPQEAVYVGDTAVDVVAAKRAGVYAIGIVGGLDSKDSLEESGPNYIIEDLSQITRLLDALGKEENDF